MKKVYRGDIKAEPGKVYDFTDFTEITGSIDARGADTKTAFPNLRSVGGYIDASGADTKTAFPNLRSVGGGINATGDFSAVKTNDEDAVQICRKSIFEINLKIGYFFADGILARLIKRKGKVARVIICGRTEVSYVVEDGKGNYSHGKTLREARAGLIYKLSSRDTSAFKKWTPKTIVYVVEAIKAYRAITGACEQGT